MKTMRAASLIALLIASAASGAYAQATAGLPVKVLINGTPFAVASNQQQGETLCQIARKFGFKCELVALDPYTTDSND